MTSITASVTSPTPTEPPMRWRTATKHSPTDHPTNNNNFNGSSARRKPSYVGLSCSVSGYSPANRYTSPDGRLTSPEQIPVSSGSQILDSVGLVLDSMRQQQQQQAGNNNHKMSNGHDVTDRAYFTSSTTTTTQKMYYREASPGSDSGSSSTGSGNLVQKQIERIYGGKVQNVGRAMSPPDSGVLSPEDGTISPNSDHATPQRKISGGFFAKRFGLSKQKERQSANDQRLVDQENSRNGSGEAATSPLDFKPLKVPAVFRLLRPEFREQLKSSSCQIPGDRTSPVKEPRSPPAAAVYAEKNKKESRVIPVVVENGGGGDRKVSTERVIPIERTSERLLNTTTAAVEKENDNSNGVSVTKTNYSRSPLNPTAAGHSMTSAALVMSSGIVAQKEKSTNEIIKQEEMPPPAPRRSVSPPPPPAQSPKKLATPEEVVEQSPEPILEEEAEMEEEKEEQVLEDDEDLNGSVSAEDFDPAAAGGIHERTLLGTIMEEDNESTASGSQINLAGKVNGNSLPTAAKRANRNGNGIVGAAGDADASQLEVQDGHYFIRVSTYCIS
jgi:hypothetical protein